MDYEDLKIEFDFKLKKSIEYHYKGDTVEGSFIKLIAPSARQIPMCAIFKQAFYRSVDEMQQRNKGVENSEVDKKEKLDGKNIIEILYLSKDIEMPKLLVSARELFTSGIATIEGEEKLTKPTYDLLLQDDIEGMLGEYLENFTLLSVLEELG